MGKTKKYNDELERLSIKYRHEVIDFVSQVIQFSKYSGSNLAKNFALHMENSITDPNCRDDQIGAMVDSILFMFPDFKKTLKSAVSDYDWDPKGKLVTSLKIHGYARKFGYVLQQKTFMCYFNYVGVLDSNGNITKEIGSRFARSINPRYAATSLDVMFDAREAKSYEQDERPDGANLPYIAYKDKIVDFVSKKTERKILRFPEELLHLK